MVRFILLGYGRTGSNLIIRNLAEHPSVRMFGELFHDSEQERERAFHALNETFGAERAERQFYREGADGAEYLREGVFYERPWNDILAVGFKMFYAHARGDANAGTAWDYLIGNEDIRVIHLSRANLLESWLSLRIASITREWVWYADSAGKRTVLPPLTLDPTECETYCNQVLAHRQWATESFRNHPTLDIEYEADIIHRFQDTMDGIHDFLGVARRPARQILEKQAKRKPREQILNYKDFEEHFRHTLYESFFR
jgi:hypothetical protein